MDLNRVPPPAKISAHLPSAAERISSISGAQSKPHPNRFDAWATHPVWGLAILVAILGITLLATFGLALPVSAFLQNTLIGALRGWLLSALAASPEWLRELAAHGILGGLGTALSLAPVLLVLFIALGYLEESGYLARASFVTDRYLRRLGLPGRSCVPLSMGFGCNTSAIAGCRVLPDRRSRNLTMLLVPFIPCTSGLATISFIAPVLFGSSASLVTWGLISLTLVMLAGTALVVSRLAPQKTPAGLHGLTPLSRLPEYHLPTVKQVGAYVWKNMSEFLIKKLGMQIVVLSVIVWALSYFPNGSMETSYLSVMSHGLEPLGAWIGISDWRFIIALLTSLIARENSIATLGVLFASHGSDASFAAQINAAITPAGGLAFLTMLMLMFPCANALIAIRQESGSLRLPLFSFAWMLAVSILLSALVYRLALVAGL